MFEFNFFYINLKNKMGNNRVNKTGTETGTIFSNDKITDEEFRRLSISSGYSIEKINFYYQSFIIDCPNGKLSR